MNPSQPSQHFQSPQAFHFGNPVNHFNNQPHSGSYPNLPPINPQQNPANNPGYPILNNQGYYPPNQYGAPINNQQASSQKAELSAKIQKLEKQFEEGWFIAYKIYIWLSIFLFGLSLGYFSMILITVLLIRGNAMFAVGYLIMAVVISLWIFHFCFMELKAMSSKNLNAATTGYTSMKIFTGVLTVFVFMVVVLGIVFHADLSFYFAEGFVGFGVSYVVPVIINLIGAKNVCKVLQEREALLFQIDNSFMA